MNFNSLLCDEILRFFPVQESAAPQTPTSDRVRLAPIAQGNRFLTNSIPITVPSPEIKPICLSVVNVFETGSAEGNYGQVSVYEDGPRGRDDRQLRQITYGRSQTTEYGLLPDLLQEYILAGGMFGREIESKMWLLRSGALAVDQDFIHVLETAGCDPIMHKVQDAFFDRMYWDPAEEWWRSHGFATGLGMLVIYDSFVHSGGIPHFLRRRFEELVPICGGNERVWIREYVNARENWLKNHSNPILRETVYRTVCFQNEIDRDNWELSLLPIQANGVSVS